MSNPIVEIFVRGAYNLVGLDSPFSAKEYGPNWSKQRRKCLERDSRQCRICGTQQSELDREPAVHHITPRQQFDNGDWSNMNALSNLITLCPSCHGRYEGRYTDCTPAKFAQKASQE